MRAQEFLLSETEIRELLSPYIVGIFNRLAGISLYERHSVLLENRESRAFVIATFGDYNIIITMLADSGVYRNITECMTRRMVIDEEDIKGYTGEFFNILCGRMISAINCEYKASARFGLPQMSRIVLADERDHDEKNELAFYFECCYGAVVIMLQLEEKNVI